MLRISRNKIRIALVSAILTTAYSASSLGEPLVAKNEIADCARQTQTYGTNAQSLISTFCARYFKSEGFKSGRIHRTESSIYYLGPNSLFIETIQGLDDAKYSDSVHEFEQMQTAARTKAKEPKDAAKKDAPSFKTQTLKGQIFAGPELAWGEKASFAVDLEAKRAIVMEPTTNKLFVVNLEFPGAVTAEVSQLPENKFRDARIFGVGQKGFLIVNGGGSAYHWLRAERKKSGAVERTFNKIAVLPESIDLRPGIACDSKSVCWALTADQTRLLKFKVSGNRGAERLDAAPIDKAKAITKLRSKGGQLILELADGKTLLRAW